MYGKAKWVVVATGLALASFSAEAQQQSMTPIDVENTRDMRFCEFVVIDGEFGDIYNTSGLNECPDEIWSALDTKALAGELGVDAVILNGPHFWVMDSQTIGFGETKSFGGIEARWAARVPASGLSGGGATPYQPFTTCKTQKMVYAEGQKIWEVLDAGGNAYVLQAHEEEFPLEDLDTLDQRMTALPDGWSWSSRVLDAPLVLDLRQADCNTGIGDEFLQYYTLVPSGG